MALNRWLPYGLMETRHLRLALMTARLIAWIGILLIAGGIAWGFTAVWLHAGGGANAAGPYALMAASSVIGLVGYGVLALALSGVLAALVGIEESQRRRVERE